MSLADAVKVNIAAGQEVGLDLGFAATDTVTVRGAAKSLVVFLGERRKAVVGYM